MSIGFSLGSMHSRDYKLVAKSVNRPILPVLIKREKSIPGVHGIYDFGNNVFDKRYIEVDLSYIGLSFNELRLRARDIAAWLSGINGLQPLVFDDEPDKYYMAKVYDEMALSNLFKIGQSKVKFECQPFAYYMASTAEDLELDSDMPLGSEVMLDTVDTYTFDVTSSPTEIEFDNWGTIKVGLGSPSTSKFEISITGSFTTLIIELNGNTINYTQSVSSKTVVFDCVKGTIKTDGVNKLSVCTGDLAKFLYAIPGTNTCTITGTSLNCTAIIDFIPQYQ